jgi:hypothetical protein
MTTPLIGRRNFLGRSLVGLVVLGAGAAGCGGEEEPDLAACGATGTTPQEQQMRTQLGYVAQATAPGKNCSRCQLYRAAASPDACGGCQLNLGPVSPYGTCNSFVART